MQDLSLALRLTTLAVFGVIVAAVSVAATVYVAGGQPESSTIDVCVNRYNGDMRMPRTPNSCASTEFPVSWESFDAANLDDTFVNEDQADSITSAMIVDAEVQSADLANDSVSTDAIQDDAVTSAQLSDDSVSTGAIQDDAVTNAQLADDSVSTSAIQDSAVTGAKLADGSVGTDTIQDSAVTGAKLADNSVGTNTIQDDAVTNDKIASDAVTSSEIEDGSVTSDDLASDSVGSDEIESGAVGSSELSSGVLTDLNNVPGLDVVSEPHNVGAGLELNISVNCGPGKWAISGGADPNAAGADLRTSFPATAQSWETSVHNGSSETITVTYFAVCVNEPSS